MSRCRALLKVSEEFIRAMCFAQLDRTERGGTPELETRKSDEKGHILVRCGRQEGECNDAWGHTIWLSDYPCGGELHSYIEEDAA